jgi:hypothetical protein
MTSENKIQPIKVSDKEFEVANENTSKPIKVRGRKLRVLWIGGALLLTIAVAAHFTWKYSGSNQWELAIDKNGIQVYTLKAPGSLVKRVKGVTHVKGTMNAVAASMNSTSTADCKKWFPGCSSMQVIKPWTPQDQAWIQLFRMKAFRPFAPREFLLKGRTSQDPRTKAVVVEFTAVPDEIPQNACCYRVSHMANSWRFTPLDNGLVEVENRVNMDIGIPYFMFNRFMPGGQFRMLGRLQKYVDDQKGGTWEGIEEKTLATVLPVH